MGSGVSRAESADQSAERRSVFGGRRYECDRLVALTDGVFAIALTLLIIDVVNVGTGVVKGEALSDHLMAEWPTLLAYLVGFITILVCWINNQRVFFYVTGADSGLLWVSGLQLALVAAVPLPTAVLAANLMGPGIRTAFILYGITYVLMAISFWGLSQYVDRRGLTDPSRDPERYTGMLKIYQFSLIWTVLSLAVATASVYPAIVMWAIMFAVFAFPAEFAHFMYVRFEQRSMATDG